MANQQNIFGGEDEDPELNQMTHTFDPWTSKAAAKKSLANAKGINRAILDELGKVYPDGLTDEELADRLNVESTVSGNSVAKRRAALKKKELIVDSGKTRPNRNNNQTVVWKLYYPPNQENKESKWTP